jgi:sugar O-acyltransferase (sialic acid O-acetyltransferase NeuD family)
LTKPKEIAIYGAGGFAREVAWLISLLEGYRTYDLVAFAADDPNSQGNLAGKPILSLEKLKEIAPNTLLIIAVGSPTAKRDMDSRARSFGFRFETLIHHTVDISSSNSLGEGSIVCCGSALTVDISIGRHVHVNLNCTVGHDVKVGDYSTFAPGVHISGNVIVEDSVFVGTGATIVNGTESEPLTIGQGSIIGAGACVTRSLEPRGLYVGVPATRKRWLNDSSGLKNA